MKKLKIIFWLLLFFALSSSIAILFLSPLLYNTPIPKGPFAVGTTSYYWTDNSRNESRSPSGKREILIQFFYPTDATNKKNLYDYQPEKITALKKIKAQHSRMPAFLWNYLLSGIKSHAAPNTLLSSQRSSYPVIIFLPGIGGDNLYNTYLEELASHGYIVVAIEPPFDTSATVLSNGTIVDLDATLIYAAQHNLRDEIYAHRTQAHKIWIADSDFVLNQLKFLNNEASSPFFSKLNLNALGFLGHSHGGGVVTELCATHDTCKVGINMDGWTKTINTTQGFDKPFLFLVNEEGIDGITDLYKNMNHEITQKIEVPGAKHAAFSDYILLKKPLIYFWVTSQNPKKVRTLISTSIISFFDRWLK